MRRNTFSIPCSSFKQGMITVIFCDLYTQVFQAIMVKMKLFLWSIVASIAAFGSESTQLLQVHSVYILPMGSAMDQFIANRLTRFGRIQVVTDPQRADAILTDRLGERFEKKLDEFYGPTQVKEVQDEKDTDEEATGIVLKDEQQPN